MSWEVTTPFHMWGPANKNLLYIDRYVIVISVMVSQKFPEIVKHPTHIIDLQFYIHFSSSI